MARVCVSALFDKIIVGLPAIENVCALGVPANVPFN